MNSWGNYRHLLRADRLASFVCLLLLVPIAYCFAGQALEWRELLRPAVGAEVLEDKHVGRSIDLARMSDLFGKPVSTESAPVSRRSYTLLGSVVASADSQSSAIIRSDGGAPHRYRVGDEIEPGLRLARIDSDQVELDYAGQIETLTFPLPGLAAGLRLTSKAQPLVELTQAGAVEERGDSISEKMSLLRAKLAAGSRP